MSLHIEQAIYPIDGADPALCGKLSIDVHDDFQSAGWLIFVSLDGGRVAMNCTFGNVYEDEERARAYATLQFPGTYYLAFRDLSGLIRRHNHGSCALDFGCGTGRSTRFLRNLGLNVIGADVSQAMLDHARALDPSGEYRLIRNNIAGEFAPGSFDIIL